MCVKEGEKNDCVGGIASLQDFIVFRFCWINPFFVLYFFPRPAKVYKYIKKTPRHRYSCKCLGTHFLCISFNSIAWTWSLQRMAHSSPDLNKRNMFISLFISYLHYSHLNFYTRIIANDRLSIAMNLPSHRVPIKYDAKYRWALAENNQKKIHSYYSLYHHHLHCCCRRCQFQPNDTPL